MRLFFQDQHTNGIFHIRKEDLSFQGTGIKEGGTINTIVFNGGTAQTVTIDQITYEFPGSCVLPLVANQHFVFDRPDELVAWQFNRDFYCIADHDSEVGCVGFLFYGIQHPLFIRLSQQELQSISSIERLCMEELEIKDRMQGEMLRTLLKRLIISITRIAKRQTENLVEISDEKFDLVRMFNLLLEANFRAQHGVRFYAEALNRSAKTLTNHFALLKYPPPSKLIQRRLVQEAKRYLFYTDKTAKEITYMLGFESPPHFSRFFKKQTGTNLSSFKSVEIDKGSIGHP